MMSAGREEYVELKSPSREEAEDQVVPEVTGKEPDELTRDERRGFNVVAEPPVKLRVPLLPPEQRNADFRDRLTMDCEVRLLVLEGSKHLSTITSAQIVDSVADFIDGLGEEVAAAKKAESTA